MKLKQVLKLIYRKIFFSGLVHYLKKELLGSNSVLDLGCGSNSSLQYCDIPYSVGVDIFESYLEESKKRKVHNQHIKADITKIEFPPKSFDAVIAIDVIEHLTKEEGYKLIKNMERWARKKIIVFTPNGYVKQSEYDGNRFQQHKCSWVVKELEDLGFKTYGINGLKKIRDSGGAIKYRPKILWCRFSDLTQKIAYYYPKIAFQILAVKEMKNKIYGTSK